MNWRAILDLMRLWHRRYRTRRQLRDLEPHRLRDIGVDEEARMRECGQWPWRGQSEIDASDASNKNARGVAARAIKSLV